MPPRFHKAVCILRATAAVSLCLLLLAVLLAPLHKHDSHEGANCLICHATQRANVAPAARDAGKVFLASTAEVVCLFDAHLRTDAPDTVRTPRAPPARISSF